MSPSLLTTSAQCLLLLIAPLTTNALNVGMGWSRAAMRTRTWHMMAGDPLASDDPFASIRECLVDDVTPGGRLDCLENAAKTAQPLNDFSANSEEVFATVRECLVDAENAAEQEACQVDGVDVATATAPSSAAAPTLPHDRTENLLGPHDSLAGCLWEAENQGEIDECRVDFEELLGVRTQPQPTHAIQLTQPRNGTQLLQPTHADTYSLSTIRPFGFTLTAVPAWHAYQVPTGECDSETEICNPEDIRTKEQIEADAAAGRSSGAKMSLCGLVGPEARFGPGKCIFRGDKCTGKRCKVNNAPCKVNHGS